MDNRRIDCLFMFLFVWYENGHKDKGALMRVCRCVKCRARPRRRWSGWLGFSGALWPRQWTGSSLHFFWAFGVLFLFFFNLTSWVMSSGYEPARHGYRYRCDENVRIRMRLRCDRVTQRDLSTGGQWHKGTSLSSIHRLGVWFECPDFSLVHPHCDTVASWPDASSHRFLSKSLCLWQVRASKACDTQRI